MGLLASALSGLAGLGSLVCFILVIIHFFQTEQTGLGIACILLALLCGIGGLIAFVKGWMDGLGTVMYAWTGCIVVGVLAAMVRAAAGG